METYKVVKAEQLEDQLTDVADAIREKTGDTAKLPLDGMAETIRKLPDLITNTVSGSSIVLRDSSALKLRGLSLYGKTTQDGTPTPDAPVELVSAGNGGSISVTVGISEGDTAPQTLTLSTPNGLPGVPVPSGGNYTDETGQQWICDEVDFGRGVYVQNVATHVSDGTEGIFQGSPGTIHERIVWDAEDIGFKPKHCIPFCNIAPGVDTDDNSLAWSGTDTVITCSDDFIFLYRLSNFGIHLAFDGEAKAWLAGRYAEGNPVTFMVARAEPMETPLSDEALAAYAVLHTNYPNTTILNDGGAGMSVSYVADTKNYIDNQISAMAAAIVNA